MPESMVLKNGNLIVQAFDSENPQRLLSELTEANPGVIIVVHHMGKAWKRMKIGPRMPTGGVGPSERKGGNL